MQTVRLGLTGIHGYAHHLTNALLTTRDAGAPLELVAITAPEVTEFPERAEFLRQKGVAILDSYAAMLQRPDLDAVWLPLPIDMHVPFAERALRAGKAVMVEKPVAATVQECDRLIAARDAAGLPVAVGFTTIYDPAILFIKRQLLAGALGRLRWVTLLGCWPRTSAYYHRSDWVGRIRRRGKWVLDSPANNAMSHFLNLAFFLLGEDEETSAAPTQVEAELYRVNDIENFDTCSLRFVTDRSDATRIVMMFTHACEKRAPTVLTIEGERGRAVWTRDVSTTLEVRGQPTVTIPAVNANAAMFQRFARLVQGVPDDESAVSTLETARMQILAVNGISEAAMVHSVPAEQIEVHPQKDGATLRVIPGITTVFEQALAERKMLHETGLVDWSSPAGRLDLRGYDHFRGVRLPVEHVS